jgi:hypothetical protein
VADFATVSLPSVTCVISAYNYERYIAAALDSVLSQDYPPELLDVVVADDESTDGTVAAIRAVQARTGGRVTLIERRNGGNSAAVSTAMRAATGELIGILDADDEWLPGKVRAQAEILAARPEVSLVYGDMQVIDSDGRVTDPSFFRRIGVPRPRGHILDQLVQANCVTNSTLMFRAAQAVLVPDRYPFADYWLAAHAAAAGELEVINRPLANYRLHAANRGFGSTGERYVQVVVREIRGRRLILVSLYRQVGLAALVQAVRGLDDRAAWVCQNGNKTRADVFEITAVERAQAADELDRGRRVADSEERVRAFALARLLDPFDHEALSAMDGAWATHVRGLAGAPTPTPTPTPARAVTVATASELISRPELISAYCDRVSDADPATLVILADRGAEIADVGARLREAMVSVGVDPDDCPDLMLVPADADVSALAPCTALTLADELPFAPGLPTFAASSHSDEPRDERPLRGPLRPGLA